MGYKGCQGYSPNPQSFPKARCQALLRLRRGSDRSKYPILGCGYAPRQVLGTLQTETGNALPKSWNSIKLRGTEAIQLRVCGGKDTP